MNSRSGAVDALSFSVHRLFLAGAAAAAVPLVLHLLKREPEPRVKFAAVKLLKHAPVEHTERRHLRELLLLALRIADAGAAGARVRAAVLRRPARRWRRAAPPSSRSTRRTACRRRAASSAPGSWRRTRSPRAPPAISSAS